MNAGRGDILVVDDDAIFRGMVAEWLTHAGYDVREAEHGGVALALLRSAPARLLITDMQMPYLNGAQTLAVVRLEFPALPVIAMSGHFGSSANVQPDAVLRQGASKVLPKPFSCDDLLRLVREIDA